MRREPLGLQHKEVIGLAFAKLALPISEYSFTNLFCWRRVRNTHVIFDDELYLEQKDCEGKIYITPTQPPPWVIKADYYYPIPTQWHSFLTQYTSDPTQSDYLVLTEKMRTYAGGKLSGKRNLVSQFLSRYESAHHPFVLKEAQVVLGQWTESADFGACQEAFNAFDELGIKGEVFLVNDEPVGFVIGELLTKEVFVIHFAKGSHKIKGLFPYMFQVMAQGTDAKYLNFEQDVGVAALHQAKHGYYPEVVLEKLRATLD